MPIGGVVNFFGKSIHISARLGMMGRVMGEVARTGYAYRRKPRGGPNS